MYSSCHFLTVNSVTPYQWEMEKVGSLSLKEGIMAL